MMNSDLSQAQCLLDLLQHPGYSLLRNIASELDLSPDESLTGTALREDVYYKACQREGIQKFFRLVDCRLYVLEDKLKKSTRTKS